MVSLVVVLPREQGENGVEEFTGTCFSFQLNISAEQALSGGLMFPQPRTEQRCLALLCGSGVCLACAWRVPGVCMVCVCLAVSCGFSCY